MSLFAEGFRRFWFPGIQNVNGITTKGLPEWISVGSFLFSASLSPTAFSLTILDLPGMAKGLAHDSSRSTCACFETVIGISPTAILPKSCGWVAIQSYYAAFFAANSLLRMAGRGFYRLETKQVSAINSAASLFSTSSPLWGTGTYFVEYVGSTGEATFTHSGDSKSHQALWSEYLKLMRNVSTELLTISSSFIPVASIVMTIEAKLVQKGYNQGGWLSFMRNMVNYQQKFGVWYPYKQAECDAASLVNIVRCWDKDPDLITFPVGDPDIISFVRVCIAIVRFCNAVIVDMAAANASRSFQRYKALALVSHAA